MVDPSLIEQIDTDAFRRITEECAAEKITSADLLLAFSVLLSVRKHEWEEHGPTTRFRSLCRVMSGMRRTLLSEDPPA